MLDAFLHVGSLKGCSSQVWLWVTYCWWALHICVLDVLHPGRGQGGVW